MLRGALGWGSLRPALAPTLLPHEPVFLRPAALRFGRCELRPLERQLLVDGRRAAVGGRAFDLLLALAERAGRLVTKQELLDVVWPDVVVEEGNLTVQMSSLRKLLGPDVIATVPGRGYRFCVAIEADGADLHAAPPAVAPALPLPRVLAKPLIGRDTDLAALGALLDAHRLVTIAGAGGIGKTLLAQHLLAARAPRAGHGACWVELAPLESPLQVVGAIGAALGVRTGTVGDALAGLVAACASLQLLLALDNAEHLHAEVARVAQALHDGAPGVRLLVTSQAPLHLACERLYRLDALAVPGAGTAATPALGFGAVTLFVERAAALDRRFRLHDGNVGAVIEICRRLDGIALAIELAAARLPLLGVTRLAAALDERLRVLTVSTSGAPPRHQTLRAGLEWSHGLLSPTEKWVFRRLAVVSGSASLELALQLLVDDAADPWAALDALGGLAERSLVALVGDADAPRYRLLESPRALALEQLRASGEEDLLLSRHARAMAALMQRAFDDHRSRAGAIDAWQRDLAPDVDNARAALAWACRHDAAAAAAIAATLLLALPGLRERVALCEAIEPLLTHDVPGELRARVQLEGSVVLRLRRSHAATTWIRQALHWYDIAEDRAGLYLALAEHVQCARRERTLADGEAATLLERLHTLERDGPAFAPQVAARGVRCATLLMKQLHAPPDELVRNQQRAIALEAAAGQPDPMASVNYTNLLVEVGRADAAIRFGLKLQDELRGTRHAWALDGVKSNLTAAWLAKDATREARALAREAWVLRTVVESQHSWSDHLALLAALEGRPRAAALLAGHADALYAARHHTRQGVEIQSYQRALALAAAALDGAAAERMRAEGAALTDDEVARIAFATIDEV
jgi:predicted ATPase/DNA-binding winged helix-turn-helix (wHTH) protein